MSQLQLGLTAAGPVAGSRSMGTSANEKEPRPADEDAGLMARLYGSPDALFNRQTSLTRFGQNPTSFVDWALGLLPLTWHERVLDVGCGWGRFLIPVARRLKSGSGSITGLDISSGVMEPAIEICRREGLPANFLIAGLSALPVADQSMDVVMANHMLYHVRDIGKALLEIDRVLKPGGYFLATSNSDRVRPAIIKMHEETVRQLGIAINTTDSSPFSMETGLKPVKRVFPRAQRKYYRDTQIFDGADALLDLYRNTGRFSILTGRVNANSVLDRARVAAQAMVNADGTISSPLLMGAFVARKEPSTG